MPSGLGSDAHGILLTVGSPAAKELVQAIACCSSSSMSAGELVDRTLAGPAKGPAVNLPARLPMPPRPNLTGLAPAYTPEFRMPGLPDDAVGGSVFGAAPRGSSTLSGSSCKSGLRRRGVVHASIAAVTE